MRRRCRLTTIRFLSLWVFIAAVSSYDAYLLVRHSDSIMYLENNPLGVYLLKLADGDISVFLNCKAAGTVVVLGSLLGLYRRWHAGSIPVIHAVAIFQLGLLLYLMFVDPRPQLTFAQGSNSGPEVDFGWPPDQHDLEPANGTSGAETTAAAAGIFK